MHVFHRCTIRNFVNNHNFISSLLIECFGGGAGSLVKENWGLLLFEFVRHQVEDFEKVSINLCICLGGILSYVSFCMVVMWMEPRMHAIIIIVGRTIHPR